jgi:hypothetical protein
MIEIIFVGLATHLRFYGGTRDCKIQICTVIFELWFKSKINQIVIIYFWNVNLENESKVNSLLND